MASRAQGEVKVREWKSGRGYALRFWAYGERRYLTLGSEHEGWDMRSAEEELANVLTDVRRGVWVSPKKKRRASVEGGGDRPAEVPAFGRFAHDLVTARKGQVAESTTAYEKWALCHLLPYFADWQLAEIDVQAVDEYRLFKVQEAEVRARAIERGRPQRNERGQVLKPLSASSINKTIEVLQWVLGIAVEYKHLTENPAVGKRRRLKAPHSPPVHLDTAGQIEVLLEAAAELDRDPCFHCTDREAIIATLVFAGPRAHELCNLLWRDVDLANGRIFIGRSKTPAGLREITMLPVLRDILAAYKAAAYRSGPDNLVFPSGTGGRRQKDNLRSRVLAADLKRADELLEARGLVPLPRGLSPHKLRHTFASVLIACGEDPISVMKQLGHTDPGFTLRVYAHLMSRDPVERNHLKALVRGERVVAREAPQPQILALAAYERPIMRALADRGGRASRREIIAAVGEAMTDRHSARDLEPLPSGPPRWKPRVGKARARLVGRGWLAAGTGRGDWELTKAGWAKVRRDEAREKPREPAPKAAEAKLAVAA